MFLVGSTDNFTSVQNLGSCYNSTIKDVKNVTLAIDGGFDGTDGWYVEWARIGLSNKNSYLCTFERWLDYDLSFTKEYWTTGTVECFEG